MKLKSIATGSSIAVTIALVTGFVISVDSVIANRYIQYKMFRLIAIDIQKNVNSLVLLFLAVWFISYVILFVAVEKMKCNKSKVIRFIIILGVLSCIGWGFESLTGRTLARTLSKIIAALGDFKTLKIYCGKFLSLLEKNFIVIIILAICFAGMPFLFWLLEKLKWGKITKFVKTSYIRKLSLIIVAFLLVLNMGIVVDSKINLPKGPNIILLVVDAWRADSLGCYDKNSKATPNIDNFAKKSVLFQNAVAQSSCTINSAPSIFYSVYPFEHNYFNYNCRVSNKFNAIAEFLKNEGYQTFGISTNPHVTSRNGLDQGFDIFIEDTAWKNTDCDEVNSRFIEWLDSNKQKKFFAMLWYMEPHSPYDPPSKYVDKYVTEKDEKENVSLRTKNHYKAKRGNYTATEKIVTKKLYTGEVNYFDTEFHKLINYLKQNGLTKNSIIILTSDHGEAFWEKGLFGHGSSLYEGQIKIPVIMSFPNQKDGKLISENVQHIDILPTILEYTKADYKAAYTPLLRGDSLKDLINGKKFKRKYLFSQLITDQYGPYRMECVRTDGFKFISTHQIGKASFTPPRFQLLDLNLDESKHKVTDEDPKLIFTNLKKQLLLWEGSIEKNGIGPKQRKHKIKDEEKRLKKRLKSLGYLQ